MNIKTLLYYEQIATDLGVLHKVEKVEESHHDTWSVAGELFYDQIDALVWAINELTNIPPTYSECDNCRLKTVSENSNVRICKSCR